jgi:Putative prokaryotic signal transducing protein
MSPSSPLPFRATGHVASGSDAEAEPPHGDLVTITRIFNSLEAEMLRGALEAEGIPATLGDVQTIQTDTLLTAAMGGIRVMVPAPFADAARSTVEAFERGELAIDELPDGASPATPEAETPAPAFRLSAATWLVLAVVVIAVVVF